MEATLAKMVEIMKCDNCGGYLRPPIRTSDNKNMCGSCKEEVIASAIAPSPGSTSAEAEVGVNRCLESIGGLLSFPCRYFVHCCPTKVSWKDAEAHENACPFRQFACPQCLQWTGDVTSLTDHVTKTHRVERSTVALSVDSCSKGTHYFDRSGEMLFLCFDCNADAGIIWITVKSVKPMDQTARKYYRVTLTANGTNYTDTKPLEYALDWNINEDTAVKIDICVLRIKLRMKSENLVNVTLDVCSRSPVYSGAIGEELLADLECPVCHDYMSAPIYQCIVGHSICNFCKPQLLSCPTCRSGFCSTIRNFTLESVSNKLHYKCMHSDSGCIFTALPSQVKQHEVTCDFGYSDCPVKDFMDCKWRGRLDQMSSHALEEHGFKF